MEYVSTRIVFEPAILLSHFEGISLAGWRPFYLYQGVLMSFNGQLFDLVASSCFALPSKDRGLPTIVHASLTSLESPVQEISKYNREEYPTCPAATYVKRAFWKIITQISSNGNTLPFVSPQCPVALSPNSNFEMHSAQRHNKHIRAGSPYQPIYPIMSNRPPQTPGRSSWNTAKAASQFESVPLLPTRISLPLRPNPGLKEGDSTSTNSQLGQPTRGESTRSGHDRDQPEGDLIDLDTTGGEDESSPNEQDPELQDAIKKFQEALRSRKERRQVSDPSDQTQDFREESAASPPSLLPLAQSAPVNTQSRVNQVTALQPETSRTQYDSNLGSDPSPPQHQAGQERSNYRSCTGFGVDGLASEKQCSESYEIDCIGCPDKFTAAQSLLEHQREKEHGYCAQCDCYFVKRESYDTHVANFHTIKCATCSMKSKVESDLEKPRCSVANRYHERCDETLDTGESMAQSIVERHPHESTVPSSDSRFQRYATIHDDEKHDFCATCRLRFSSNGVPTGDGNSDARCQDSSASEDEAKQAKVEHKPEEAEE
ncbi:hypothetical protein VTO42DRAFT_361 [Malbranchea cinnamomea]